MKTNKLNEKCIFNEEVQENIYNLYRGSNLETLEYLTEILSKDETIKEFYNDYLSVEHDSMEATNIFWNAMECVGMIDYIEEYDKVI